MDLKTNSSPSWSSATSAKSGFVASALLETKSREQTAGERGRIQTLGWRSWRPAGFHLATYARERHPSAPQTTVALPFPTVATRPQLRPHPQTRRSCPGLRDTVFGFGRRAWKGSAAGARVCDPAPGCSRSRHLSICAHKSSVYAPICPPAGDLVAGRGPLSPFSGFPGPQENRSLPPPPAR